MTDRIIPPLPMTVIRELVARALAEDLGRGDVTTDSTVPFNAKA